MPEREASTTAKLSLYCARLALCFYLLAAWGIVSLYTGRRLARDVCRPDTLPPGLNLCDCGSTVQEAVSLQLRVRLALRSLAPAVLLRR